MVEFFLGIIAFVLLVAFWEKVKPVLGNLIKGIVAIVKIPFTLFSVWVKGLIVTINVLWTAIKHSWKTHKILFVIAILIFSCVLLLADVNVASLMTKKFDRLFILLIKYFCLIVGVWGSVFCTLVATWDVEDITKIKSWQDIENHRAYVGETLDLVIISYPVLFMYMLYYVFGIQFAVNVYVALFFSIMIVSILVWLKNNILGKKNKKK